MQGGWFLNKTYSFRLLLGDNDIRKKFNTMEGKERSAYIRRALRFYYNCGEEIKNMSENVSKIIDKLDEISVKSLKTENESHKDNSSENEDLLIDSIEDILNL